MENSTETYNRLRTAPLAASCETVQSSAPEVLGELVSAVLRCGGIAYCAVDSHTILRSSRRRDLPVVRGVPCEIQKLDIPVNEAAFLIQRELSEGKSVLFSGTLSQTKKLYEILVANTAVDNLLLCGIVQRFSSQYHFRRKPLSKPWRSSGARFWPADFILTDKSPLLGTEKPKHTDIALRTPKARQLFDSISDAFPSP